MRRAVCVFVDWSLFSSMTVTPRILFLADAGPQIGGGHVMRCLTLAAALSDLGASCAFMAPPPVAQLMARFARADIAQAACAPADLVAAASDQSADIIVMDHYGLGLAQEQRLMQRRKLVVFEDLPGRRHTCHLLLDQTLARVASDYAGLVPQAATVLAGPTYALVRPEFCALRLAALARRRQGVSGGPILVAMGLTDVMGITARVVEGLLSQAEVRNNPIIAVVGAAAPSLPRLRTLAQDHPRLSIEIETLNMAELMAKADLGIGAGGSSTWERCCLGLPSITVVLADNQADQTRRLAAVGASLALDGRAADFDQALALALSTGFQAPDILRELGKTASRICDGQGASRVAKAVLAL